jgi:hypothetical protein
MLVYVAMRAQGRTWGILCYQRKEETLHPRLCFSKGRSKQWDRWRRTLF